VLGQLREKFPRAGLVLVGAGSLCEEVRRRADEGPCGEHVLLCGDVGREVALRVIADSDLMLRTTLYDGDSISVREAVHFGVPVVATDRAPRPEGVRVVPAQDLARLREAAEQCLSNGAQRAPSDGPNEDNLAALLELYEELMRGNY
jgi:glycosyltransferase involved in cell wall biosynthesis